LVDVGRTDEVRLRQPFAGVAESVAAMSSQGVWVVFPTANPERADRAIKIWQAKGYNVAILTNTEDCASLRCQLHIASGRYSGYFRSANALAKAVLALDPDFRVLVCAADDMEPDPNLTADAIAEQYLTRFPSGFGVLQPTGDDLDGTDRICGSPWVGRAWIETAYGGHGPLCEDYTAFFGDEELLNVSKTLGALWQRPDLTQYHDHWSRKGRGAKTAYQEENNKHWAADKRTFERRVAEGRGA
jgi:hypothetical protein